MSNGTEEEVRSIAVRICRLVRAKQPLAPPTHRLPQIAVVLDQSRQRIWIGAGNLPDRLSQHGRVLARTLHQNDWQNTHGRDPAYVGCVEVDTVDPVARLSDWDAAIRSLRVLGYEVYLTKKFR
jgi:hypothetical protein